MSGLTVRLYEEYLADVYKNRMAEKKGILGKYKLNLQKN